MNGMDKITDRIWADTNQKIAAVTAKADGEVEAMLAEAKAQAESRYQLLCEEGKTLAAQSKERKIGAAKLQERKLLLATKQEMVSAAFDAALENLCTMKAEQAVPFLTGLALQAVRTGKELLIFNAKDKAAIGGKVVEAVNGKLQEKGVASEVKLAEQTGSFVGGFLLKDGDIEINCSYETILRMHRDDLAGEVAAILF